MNRVFLVIAGLCSSVASLAQTPVSLEQAIETALKNNVDVRQDALDVQTAEVYRNQARANLFPTASGSVNHGINRGRSIDPFTNAYVNQQISYASYGLGANAVLFNGFSLQNSIKQNALALEASRMDLQQSKDNVTLRVILAYLTVLNNEDILDVQKKQAAVTQKQVERLEVLNRQGAIRPPVLYDLKGQLKTNELAVVDRENAVETSRLALARLMNVPYTKDMRLERFNINEQLTLYPYTAAEVYQKAVNQLAVVKSSELRTKSSQAAWKATKGELYPTLFLSGNVNTNYSSIASRDVLVGATEAPTPNYVLLNGSKVPVMAKQNSYESQKIDYGSQLHNNIFSNVALGVRVPLFNGLQARNRVKLAKIEIKTNELAEENTKEQLRQEVDQAYINMTTSWERYKVVQDQVAAYAESFRAAEVSFNAGVSTSVDYLIAKNNLDQANVNLIVAKYDYLLRIKILNYYYEGAAQ